MTTTPPIPTPEQALAAYRPLVEGNEQAVPILVWATPESIYHVAISSIPGGGMQEALRHILPSLDDQLGKPDWILLSAETWIAPTAVHKEEVEKFQPGDLQRRADGGEAIDEGVQLTAFSASTGWAAIARFERVGGQVIWQDLEIIPGQPEGGIPDIFLHYLR